MSKKKRDYILFIEDIVEMIEKIERYTHGKSFKNFAKDEMAIDAVIRNFEIIGEAARHLSENFRKKHPEVPWEKIFGMRNRLVHDYLGVDLDVVWDTVNNFVPVLKKQIEEILSSL